MPTSIPRRLERYMRLITPNMMNAKMTYLAVLTMC